MADKTLNVTVICGSLRKASYNAALGAGSSRRWRRRDLSLKPAPPWDNFPVYNADDQASDRHSRRRR